MNYELNMKNSVINYICIYWSNIIITIQQKHFNFIQLCSVIFITIIIMKIWNNTDKTCNNTNVSSLIDDTINDRKQVFDQNKSKNTNQNKNNKLINNNLDNNINNKENTILNNSIINIVKDNTRNDINNYNNNNIKIDKNNIPWTHKYKKIINDKIIKIQIKKVKIKLITQELNNENNIVQKINTNIDIQQKINEEIEFYNSDISKNLNDNFYKIRKYIITSITKKIVINYIFNQLKKKGKKDNSWNNKESSIKIIINHVLSNMISSNTFSTINLNSINTIINKIYNDHINK